MTYSYVSQETLFTIGSGVGIFLGLWITGNLLEKNIKKFGRRNKYNSPVISLLASSIKYLCLTLGGISLAGSFGVDIRGLLAGLGLTGFALGFALKDLLANTIAGAFILLYQPFKLGEEIKIQTTKSCYDQGKVIFIDLRYTTVENAEEKILIPNSLIFTNSISIIK